MTRSIEKTFLESLVDFNMLLPSSNKETSDHPPENLSFYRELVEKISRVMPGLAAEENRLILQEISEKYSTELSQLLKIAQKSLTLSNDSRKVILFRTATIVDRIVNILKEQLDVVEINRSLMMELDEIEKSIDQK